MTFKKHFNKIHVAPCLKPSRNRRNVLQFLLSKEYLVSGAYTELEKES